MSTALAAISTSFRVFFSLHLLSLRLLLPPSSLLASSRPHYFRLCGRLIVNVVLNADSADLVCVKGCGISWSRGECVRSRSCEGERWE